MTRLKVLASKANPTSLIPATIPHDKQPASVERSMGETGSTTHNEGEPLDIDCATCSQSKSERVGRPL